MPIFQVFEEALKTWTEKQKLEKSCGPRPYVLSEEETAILVSFTEATQALVKWYEEVWMSVSVIFVNSLAPGRFQ